MNVLEQIMGIGEAAERWRLSRTEVIRMCSEGLVQAVRLDGGDVWVLAKEQPHPVSGEAPPRQQKPHTDKASYMSTRLLDALYE